MRLTAAPESATSYCVLHTPIVCTAPGYGRSPQAPGGANRCGHHRNSPVPGFGQARFVLVLDCSGSCTHHYFLTCRPLLGTVHCNTHTRQAQEEKHLDDPRNTPPLGRQHAARQHRLLIAPAPWSGIDETADQAGRLVL